MTYNCDFVASRTNGHWHLSQKEAERCKQQWSNWSVFWKVKGKMDTHRYPTIDGRGRY
jgi:hypothetical protein